MKKRGQKTGFVSSGLDGISDDFHLFSVFLPLFFIIYWIRCNEFLTIDKKTLFFTKHVRISVCFCPKIGDFDPFLTPFLGPIFGQYIVRLLMFSVLKIGFLKSIKTGFFDPLFTQNPY